MIFKHMSLEEAKEFYGKLKKESKKAPSAILKIAMDDIWFFTDGLQKDYRGGINMERFVLNPKLIEKIEKNGYCVVDYENGSFYFSKYSPAGQDFGFEVEGDDLDELASNIYKYYDDFDVSYETYLWLDNTGHGTNGAPYDMKDLYEDMRACEDFILELYEIIKEED